MARNLMAVLLVDMCITSMSRILRLWLESDISINSVSIGSLM